VKISSPAHSETAREDARQSPQHPQSAGDAGIGVDESGPSSSGEKEKDRAACPRHADAGFGPHPHCRDCADPGLSAACAEQPQQADVADVALAASAVSGSGPAGTCTVCGEPLDLALIEAGFTDHGEDSAA
jgi:hypothetical protein